MKIELKQILRGTFVAAALAVAGIAPAFPQSDAAQSSHGSYAVSGVNGTTGTHAGKVFGATYAPVGVVGEQKTQVVYYRSANAGSGTAANVYVDGEYHTSLLPKAYTVFCVAPGQHILGAYLNEAPIYAGKNSHNYPAQMTGGQTYFLRVSEDGSGRPLPVARAEAERELVATREQVHALSRASRVEACDYTAQAPVAVPPKPAQMPVVGGDHALSSDALFGFGKGSYDELLPDGRAELSKLGLMLSEHSAEVRLITVTGHADEIGSASAAKALGARRAQTVRQDLINSGVDGSKIIVRSAGSTEPVVKGCSGKQEERIRCLAPNRRVVVNVALADHATQ